jgi:methyltransferase-like protein/cyclopropane fatty-acyl-phospholipid synthase-like methyltransferase
MTSATSYDEVPYRSQARYPTHPDCLATLATLLGMQPAPVDRCRVLELGCGDGGNLLPMAQYLPDSHFVGIDLSARQIADGQAVVDAVGLTNIKLYAMSVLEVGPALGEFDYLICHGVWSWVPPEVQEGIFRVCRERLAPQGVAYISYNTYPGWHRRSPVREMLRYHAAQFATPADRVLQARALLDFVADATPDADSGYARMLREEAELLRREQDYYLFHEHLEDDNHPVYFHEFMERAAVHRLQYLGESWYHTTPQSLPAEVQATLRGMSSDLLHLEQYLDFLQNRTFRRSLLCHAECRLDRAPSLDRLARLSASALARPLGEDLDAASPATVRFQTEAGASVETNVPTVKAALLALYRRYPECLSLAELEHAVGAQVGHLAGYHPAQTRVTLGQTLLQFYLSNLVALHAYVPHFVTTVSQCPVASPLARYQAVHGRLLTNAWHQLLEAGPLERRVLPQLDGRHPREALLGDGVADEPPVPVSAVEASLQRLAGHALLVG